MLGHSLGVTQHLLCAGELPPVPGCVPGVTLPRVSPQSSVKESGAEEELTPMALARQVEGLKQQLLSSHLEKVLGPGAAVDFADPEGALAK